MTFQTDWIKEVPAGWTIGRLKNSVSSIVNGIWGDEPSGDENDIVCVRVADFDRTKLSVSLNNPTYRNVSLRDAAKRLVSKGDLLIEKSGGSGELNPVGFVVRFADDSPAVCSNFVARIKTSDVADSNFFKYVHAAAYSAGINRRSIKQTTGIQNLDTDSYLNELVPYPPLDAQKDIASFLDHHTAKLDQLVEKKQRLIELLREKRQAIITQAVTKGLDPNVPMKDSGIPWLGEVPVHWEIRKMKYSVNLIAGFAFKSDDYIEDGIPVIRIGDIDKDGQVSIGNVKTLPLDYLGAYRQYIVNSGDCLMAMTGATIGKVGKFYSEKALLNQRVCKFLTRDGLNADFMWFFLNTNGFKEHVRLYGFGGAQPNISEEQIIMFPLVLPSLLEQVQIAERLEKNTKHIDKIIEISARSVALLLEYRQTLISAAVTGQIDVRRYMGSEVATVKS